VASHGIIEEDFHQRIKAATHGVGEELHWEADALNERLKRLCDHDSGFDRALLALERVKGDVKALVRDQDTWMSLHSTVPEQAKADHLDDLEIVAGDGTVLGATDPSRNGTKDPRLAALIKQKGGPPSIKPHTAPGERTMEVHCARTSNGVTAGLVASRRIRTDLNRIAKAYRLTLDVIDSDAPVPPSSADHEVKGVNFSEVTGLKVVASVPRSDLMKALAELDRSILSASAVAMALALIIAWLLARNISGPIAALAHETREVVTGEPKHVKARGGSEIASLAAAFNKTVDELTAMRKRLANTERIHARREVARQIAHEIKNPLAPIQAAVETLRRLRARDDAAFDDYFEEATTTVLTEVRRISNIVTEFTRFNRMPAPNPAPLDLVQVARGVVTLHAGAPDGSDLPAGGDGLDRVTLTAEAIPQVCADRDQIIQILTNLIQNGLDAASAVRPDPRVTVTIDPLPEDRVRIVVRDNGPGVPEEFLPRLFEPYATTKAKGTGLGLAIVQRIVFEHGGEIAYRKAQKGGAVFEISLPVAGPPLLTRAPTTETTARPG
jgi:signal transduction histidine kinase